MTTISFVQPRVAEQSAGRRTNFDLVFFCGVLATALLFAGGVVLLIDRFHRSARTASPKPVPLFKVKRIAKQRAFIQADKFGKADAVFKTFEYYLGAA